MSPQTPHERTLLCHRVLWATFLLTELTHLSRQGRWYTSTFMWPLGPSRHQQSSKATFIQGHTLSQNQSSVSEASLLDIIGYRLSFKSTFSWFFYLENHPCSLSICAVDPTFSQVTQRFPQLTPEWWLRAHDLSHLSENHTQDICVNYWKQGVPLPKTLLRAAGAILPLHRESLVENEAQMEEKSYRDRVPKAWAAHLDVSVPEAITSRFSMIKASFWGFGFFS